MDELTACPQISIKIHKISLKREKATRNLPVRVFRNVTGTTIRSCHRITTPSLSTEQFLKIKLLG